MCFDTFLAKTICVCVLSLILDTFGHGGHGPGWQRMRHECPHSGLSGLPQASPQECGTTQGSKGGSATFPQKHSYLAGICPGAYGWRHFGQPH